MSSEQPTGDERRARGDVDAGPENNGHEEVPAAAAAGDDEVADTTQGGVPRMSSKSPLFEAYHADRYQRQSLIREINTSNGRHLLCYVGGPQAALERSDVLAFADLLHHVPDGANIDLMLHTGGGDPYATEKIVSMFWSRIGKDGTFRVIVPDFAKSAGTLLALGSDCIVMSDTSELGPIDPQVVRRTATGTMGIAVQHHLDAYRNASNAFRADPNDPVARAEFEWFDPPTIVSFKAVVRKAQQVSDKHLKEGMFRRGHPGAYTKITSDLLDTDKWVTHQSVIGPAEARELGLVIEVVTHDDPQWQRWWRLHCLHRLALTSESSRIFESDPIHLQY